MNATPGAVLRAAENQDWAALRALLEPPRQADAQAFDFQEMLASTRADPAAATRRYFTGAVDAAAAPAERRAAEAMPTRAAGLRRLRSGSAKTSKETCSISVPLLQRTKCESRKKRSPSTSGRNMGRI